MDGMSTREVSATLAFRVLPSMIQVSGIGHLRKATEGNRERWQGIPRQVHYTPKTAIYLRQHLARRSSRQIDAAQHMEIATTDRMLTTNRAARISREVQAQECVVTVTGDVKNRDSEFVTW